MRYLNSLKPLCRYRLCYSSNPCSPCRGYRGKLKFGVLPVSTFCSGHTFFTQRMPFKLKLEPYVVHATFQFSGTPGKRFRFREALLWNVRRQHSPLLLLLLAMRLEGSLIGSSELSTELGPEIT